MNTDLTAAIQARYTDADRIEATDIYSDSKLKLREMVQFDFLQFLAYLCFSDGADMRSELTFIKDYLGYDFDIARLNTFKYQRTTSSAYVSTPPRSLSYFAQWDIRSATTFGSSSLSHQLVQTYQLLGESFIACNSVSSPIEIGHLSRFSGLMQPLQDQIQKQTGQQTQNRMLIRFWRN